MSTLEEDIIDELKGFDFASLLTPQERKIIVLFVIENKSVTQISDATSLSLGRVHKLLKTAGEKIRTHLKLEE